MGKTLEEYIETRNKLIKLDEELLRHLRGVEAERRSGVRARKVKRVDTEDVEETLVVPMIGRNGMAVCPWELTTGDICGKNCRDQYCSYHKKSAKNRGLM